MHKKGEVTFKMTLMVAIYLIVIMFVLFTTIFFVKKYVFFDEDITEVEANVVLNALLSSDIGLFSKKGGVTDFNTLNASFFSSDGEESLSKLFNFSDQQPYVALKMTLYEKDGKTLYKDKSGKTVSSVYLNKRQYDAWKDIALMNGAARLVQSAGSAYLLNKKFIYTVDNGNLQEMGVVEIDVVMPRS